MFRPTRARLRTQTRWSAITIAVLAAFASTTPATAQRFPPPSSQTCWGQAVQIHGTQYNDTITVTSTKVTIVSGKTTQVIPLAKPALVVIATYGGNDNVSVESNIDTRTCLGTGTDTISASDGSHRVRSQGVLAAFLADGDDNIDVEGTATKLELGGGANDVTVENGADEIGDLSGDNEIWIREGAVVGEIFLGSGDNEIQVDDHAVVLGDIDLGSGDNEIQVDDHAVVQGEIDLGSGDNDILVGANAAVDRIDSGSGDHDIQIGRDGMVGEVILGSGDNEIELHTGAEVDIIELGGGSDTVTIANYAYVIELKTRGGNDTIDVTGYGAAGMIRAGSGNDTINAGNAHTTIDTGTGLDILNAGGGFDRCYITAADDTYVNCELVYEQ